MKARNFVDRFVGTIDAGDVDYYMNAAETAAGVELCEHDTFIVLVIVNNRAYNLHYLEMFPCGLRDDVLDFVSKAVCLLIADSFGYDGPKYDKLSLITAVVDEFFLYLD